MRDFILRISSAADQAALEAFLAQHPQIRLLEAKGEETDAMMGLPGPAISKEVFFSRLEQSLNEARQGNTVPDSELDLWLEQWQEE